MKRKITFLTLISILVFSFTSCTLKKKSVPLPNNLDLAVEEIFAADLMEDIFAQTFDIIFDLSEYGIFKSEDGDDRPDCRTKTVEHPEDTRWPEVITLDFGDGCEDPGGNIRKGKIIITVNGRYREEGSSRNVTFEDYYVNDNRIEGTRIITNTGREDGMLVFTIELEEGKIIRADGVEIRRNASKTRMWIKGEDTPAGWDDVFVINGTVNKVNGNRIQITKTIKNLLRARNCRFPLSGIVEITTDDDRPLVVLDYGDGQCDKWATVTIGEGDESETWIVDLEIRL